MMFHQSREAVKEDSGSQYVPEARVPDLQHACVAKIIEHKAAGKLQENGDLAHILYRWKEWSENESWKQFVAEMTMSDRGLLTFVECFASEGLSTALGDYVVKKRWAMDSRALSDFISREEVKARLKDMQRSGSEFCQKNKEMIDLILARIGKTYDPFHD